MSNIKLDDKPESSRAPRTIVLCFDGTNSQYCIKNTNVVKFFGLLRKDCPDQQLAYYQAGLGTYFAPGIVSPVWTWLASLLDEAVAWYLDAHVMGGYKYLMDNHRTGDKICLFGFSRGAYTARALAGMLYKVGLLPRGNSQQVNFAYKVYKRTDKEGGILAAGFKQTFAQDVNVDFIGVWDTVQSTGALVNRELPFSDSNTSIRVFRHALSLDEHRSRFRPNLYHWAPSDDDAESASTGILKAIGSTVKRFFTRKSTAARNHQSADQGPFADSTQLNGGGGAEEQSDAEFVAEEQTQQTDVLEVWFSGCHSDVGGGNVEDNITVSLAQVPLHWMVEHVMQSGCGIVFDNDQLASIGFRVQPQSTIGNANNDDVNGSKPSLPAPTVGTHAKHADATAPLYDELILNKLWWILEFLPYTYVWQDSNGKWHSKFMIGFGRGRVIPFEKPKFHHSVKARMEYGPLQYKPKATYDHHQVYV